MVIAGLPIPILGVRGITVVEGTRGLDSGGDSLGEGEALRGGVRGDSGGGVMGTLFGDVSGEASVENGDCLSRMERSSSGLELHWRVLNVRPLPRRWKCIVGLLGEDRVSSDGGGDADDISSITSISRLGSSSSTGLTASSMSDS